MESYAGSGSVSGLPPQIFSEMVERITTAAIRAMNMEMVVSGEDLVITVPFNL